MGIAAAVAVILSVIGGLVSAYAALRQRKTEDTAIVVGAMRDHMRLIGEENIDYRARLRSAEQTIGDLRVEVANCESDKRQQAIRIEKLEESNARLEAAVNGLRERESGNPGA